MSVRDERISLLDMRDHAREAIEMLEGVSRSAFEESRMMQLALTRLVEIIGEKPPTESRAARRTSTARSPGLC